MGNWIVQVHRVSEHPIKLNDAQGILLETSVTVLGLGVSVSHCQE
jgi:hypothetical protein